MHELFDDVERMRYDTEISRFGGCCRQRFHRRGLRRGYSNRRIHGYRALGLIRVHAVTDGQDHYIFARGGECVRRILDGVACSVSKTPGTRGDFTYRGIGEFDCQRRGPRES